MSCSFQSRYNKFFVFLYSSARSRKTSNASIANAGVGSRLVESLHSVVRQNGLTVNRAVAVALQASSSPAAQTWANIPGESAAPSRAAASAYLLRHYAQ